MDNNHRRKTSREAANSDHENGLDSEFTMVEAETDDGTNHVENIDSSTDIDLKPTRTYRRGDEYDVDFSDAKHFATYRWRDILKATHERLSPSDQRIAAKCCDWQDLVADIQGKITDPGSGTSMKRQMSRIHTLPRTLSYLAKIFTELVEPLELNFELLWGLIYLNLKNSYASPDRLKRTCDILYKIRSVVSLFIKILEALDEPNEELLAVVDFMDPITIILTDSLNYLHEHTSDAKAEQAWPELNENVNYQLSVLDGLVKHVSETMSYSKVNLERQIKNMNMRHALIPESEEPGTFPNRILPFAQNPRFYGRSEELEKIGKCLGPKDVYDRNLRTYTIYGRRGVGKTEIALQFAYTNRSGFDAIFWIQCETSVAIRQSFTNVAISLNLPGADREGRHEENLLAVQSWLKRTKKRWLMIFDNAERDQILRAYWPIGAAGSILITSRKYHNFAKDLLRQGDTIKPFDPKQSWDLLLQLLGEDWFKMDQEGRIPQTEVSAAKNMLYKLEGLALAIRQAAILIKDPRIGGPTVAKTYEMFRERIRTLPERHSAPRSSSERALDALWDMTFNSLSKESRSLLGVLAWLSPDNILIETFQPRNQKALSGSLSFCKQDPLHLKDQDRASLFTVITPSPGFDRAMNELLSKELIKQDGRILSIHRVVQEAVNYHDVDELQDSFNMACRLVYEQFPKQDGDESLYSQWNVCANYIHHGVHLSKKYSDDYSKIISSSEYFVKLLSNCGWYLHEMGDYEVSKRVIETAILGCPEKDTLVYAQLLNIAGSRHYDTNRLAECRSAWEHVLRIRKEKLAHDDPSIAAMYNNLGNLETAFGNFEESRDYFERASLIWINGGDTTAGFLALTYLCMGRMYMFRYNLKEAERMTQLAESLFVRMMGANKGFMGHVHYAHGNIQYRQKLWQLARRSYDSCLKISLVETPIHPITASAYFSIGCVEYEQGHHEVAKAYLDKARAIAELRSPTRDDGMIARILWKTACVLEADTFGRFALEAKDLRTRAEVARQAMLAGGEGGLIPFLEDFDEGMRDPEEDSYDALVPLFFR